jgi:tetratricopeptide (TPR) repeat protein
MASVLRALALVFALWLGGTSAARAEWHEASSPHFLVYADQSEKQVRAFSEMLERYRSAMRVLYKLPDTPISPSNRLTVFVVRNADQVRKLLGDGSRYTQGFYQSRAGGSVAFIPRVDSNGVEGRVTDGELVLLHEYAHHFMYSAFSGSAPLWFTEGFAEFYATAKFEKDGSVGLGLPARHRSAELLYAKDVPLDVLLSTRKYRETATSSYDAFYGRSWLLFHYLMLSGKRPGQLADYLVRLNKGEGEETAAVNAFGDLAVLSKELGRYLQTRRMSYMNIGAGRIATGAIAIRPLSEAEAAILPVVMRSKRGVNEEQAKLVVEDARKIAATYPDDAFVQTALAEAEYDAGNDDAAIAAADRAIAKDPKAINALIQRMYALFRKAEDDSSDAMWPKVRAAVSAANSVENDNPIPLSFFYRTFAAEGKTPPPVAIQGLEKALNLAPYDTGLRLTLAQYQIKSDAKDGARETLGPLINHPHDTTLATLARKLLDGDIKPQDVQEEGASPDANDDAS